jgi:hypothetical protein
VRYGARGGIFSSSGVLKIERRGARSAGRGFAQRVIGVRWVAVLALAAYTALKVLF